MKRLKPDNLQPADILLYHGTGWIADAIRFFDYGGQDSEPQYSHVAIYTDKGVIEAVAHGVVGQSLAKSVKGSKYVDVWRWCDDKGVEMGQGGYNPKYVVENARQFVRDKERYAFEQLFLLAILCTGADYGGLIWRLLLEYKLKKALKKLIKKAAQGKEPMICSELVYRCFQEAHPPYGMSVDRIVYLMSNTSLRWEPHRVEILMKMLAEDQSLADADWVTPRGIQESPNTVKKGRLEA